MIHKGNIEYELLINEEGENGEKQHGVKFKCSIEDNIATLLIAAEMLEDKVASCKEIEKSATQRTKLDMKRTIADMNKVIKYINDLAYNLCNHYEEFQVESAKWEEKAKEQALAEAQEKLREHLQENKEIPTDDQIKEI
jgi:hypothetical protein